MAGLSGCTQGRLWCMGAAASTSVLLVGGPGPAGGPSPECGLCLPGPPPPQADPPGPLRGPGSARWPFFLTGTAMGFSPAPSTHLTRRGPPRRQKATKNGRLIRASPLPGVDSSALVCVAALQVPGCFLSPVTPSPSAAFVSLSERPRRPQPPQLLGPVDCPVSSAESCASAPSHPLCSGTCLFALEVVNRIRV